LKLLHLHFSQISKIWSKSQNNNYSDKSRDNYHKKLAELYDKLSNEDFDNRLSRLEIEEKKQMLSFFSDSITFLDNSTVTSLPFEVVKCLEIALNEWASDEYIIVTTKAKGINAFSFDPRLAVNDAFYEVIEKNYNIIFDKRLIQINVPEYLLGDYLANVVLYHELGHFIEGKFHIPDIIYKEFADDYVNKKIQPDFYKYFPFVKKSLKSDKNSFFNSDIINQIKYHIGEYFCDLFASQYVEGSVNHYLSYISNDGYSTTHPATKRRVELVDSFLKNKNSYTLDKIKSAVEKMTGESLRIRYEKFNSNDFVKLLPINITNEKELHYLYVYGWDLWLSNWSSIKHANKMGFTLKATSVYNIINDLIEKSIGNFIVSKTWKEIKDVPTKK